MNKIFYDSISETIYCGDKPMFGKLSLKGSVFNGKESIRHYRIECLEPELWLELKKENPLIDNDVLIMLGKNPKNSTLTPY